MHQKFTLNNGLRIITSENSSAKSTSVSLFIKVGSRYETEKLCGISHFVEHMLFKGTEKRPNGLKISESIEGIGGIINAEAGKEVTLYWTKAAAEHFELTLDVLSDIILNSIFDPNEIEKERKVIFEELNMLNDSPPELVESIFDAILWGNHPMGWEIGGTRESVMSITKEDIVNFRNKFYNPENTVISIVGPQSSESMANLIQKYFGNWQTEHKSCEPPEPSVFANNNKIKIEYK